MQVQAHFTFYTTEEFTEFCKHMAKFAGLPGGEKAVQAPVKTSAPTPVTPVEAVKRAEAPAPVAKKPEEIKTAVTGESLAPKAIQLAAEPTFENVREAALAVARKTKKKEAVFAILKPFGADKIGPQLKAEDYGAFIAECQKVIDATA